jgi:hypothetical protein
MHRNDREHEQKMYQSSGNMKHGEATNPVRIMSASARRKIAQSQARRWRLSRLMQKAKKKRAKAT